MLFGSQILETAIGLVFIILLLSLICTAINEVITRTFELRSRHLKIGLEQMLQGNGGLFNWFLDHPLIKDLKQSQGVVVLARMSQPYEKRLAAHIPKDVFSRALSDLLKPPQQILMDAMPVAVTRKAVQDTLQNANGDPVQFRNNLTGLSELEKAIGQFLVNFDPGNVEKIISDIQHIAANLPDGVEKTKILRIFQNTIDKLPEGGVKTRIRHGVQTITDTLPEGAAKKTMKQIVNGPRQTLASLSKKLDKIKKGNAYVQWILAVLQQPGTMQPTWNLATAVSPSIAAQPVGMPISDVLLNSTDEATALAAMRQNVLSFTNQDLRRKLLTLIDDSQGSVDKLRAGLEHWYDNMMDQVSGWYKRTMQLVSFILGFAIALTTNADMIYIGREMYIQPALRVQAANAAEGFIKGNTDIISKDPAQGYTTATSVLATLDLPLGWKVPDFGQSDDIGLFLQSKLQSRSLVGWLLWAIRKLISWLIAGAAISLGAPFWFDMLSKMVNLRGYGTPEPQKDAGN